MEARGPKKSDAGRIVALTVARRKNDTCWPDTLVRPLIENQWDKNIPIYSTVEIDSNVLTLIAKNKNKEIIDKFLIEK